MTNFPTTGAHSISRAGLLAMTKYLTSKATKMIGKTRLNDKADTPNFNDGIWSVLNVKKCVCKALCHPHIKYA